MNQNTINVIITGYNVMRRKGLKPLNKCVTLSDKLKWLAIFDNNDLKVKCADKIKAKEYVKEKLGIDINIPILKIYDNIDQINLSELPNEFIIKTNHGSGNKFYEIVNNKNNVNLSYLKNKFQKALDIDYSLLGGELFYHFIDRKIFAEKLLKDKFYLYKICCCNGKPILIRVTENDRISSFFDINFKPLDINKKTNHHSIICNYNHIDPDKIQTILDYSKILSSDFKFVRVDFMVTNDKIYFNELTFIPASGCNFFITEELDLHLGKHLIINV